MKPAFALLETASRPMVAGAPDAENRQWVKVLPAKMAVPRDGRGPWKVSDAAAIVRDSLAYVGKAGMMVDYNHQSMHSGKNGQPAPAAGWVVRMEAIKGEVWALVKWTDKAAAHIRAREFRHLSPVLVHDAAGTVNRIHNIALVNEPALDELVALAQSESPVDKNAEAMAELQNLLGLPETAELPDVLPKVRALLTSANSAAPDPAAFVPMAEFEKIVAEANGLRQGMTMAEASAYVEAAIRNGKIIPALRDWGVQLCTVNKPAFESFLERTSGGMQTLLSVAVPAVHPDREKAGAIPEDEAEIAERLGLSAEQYRAGRAGSRN